MAECNCKQCRLKDLLEWKKDSLTDDDIAFLVNILTDEQRETLLDYYEST